MTQEATLAEPIDEMDVAALRDSAHRASGQVASRPEPGTLRDQKRMLTLK